MARARQLRHPPRMPYVVIGVRDGRRVEERRPTKSGAALIASEMIAANHSGVILIDLDGDWLSLSAFRRKHWSGSRTLARYVT